MNIKKLIRIASVILLTLCCVNTFTSEQCYARKMTVDWGMPTVTAQDDGAAKVKTDDVIATRAEALNTAIIRAATEEAFALLPQDISARQKSALRRYMASKAPTLVRGYHEESVTMLPSGQQRLVVDVNVDKQWLIDALKRLGAYYIAGHDTLPCTLYYLGQTDADKKSTTYKKAASSVALLSTAAGLRSADLTFMTTTKFMEMDKLAGVGQPAEVVPPTGVDTISKPNDAIAEALNAAKESAGSGDVATMDGTGAQTTQVTQAVQPVPQKVMGPKSLRFILASHGKDAWSGKLQGPDYSAEANGSTIDMVWEKLWPAYLSTHFARTESDSDAASLQVWGWSSADGAVAFDKAMRQWYKNQGGDVHDLDLLQIIMQAGAVKAVWRVDIANQSKLKAFVRDYASQRRLRYELAALGQGLDSDE